MYLECEAKRIFGIACLEKKLVLRTVFLKKKSKI